MELMLILLLSPLVVLIVWFSVKTLFNNKPKLNQCPETNQICWLKLKDSQLINGYELMQILNDQGFEYNKTQGVFDYTVDGQTLFRCMNLKKPGKFYEPFEDSAVPGIMLVTDLTIIYSDLEDNLEKMYAIADKWQDSFGGYLMDQNNIPVGNDWTNHLIDELRHPHNQSDWLKEC
ncbi:MAG: hypothetical protein CMF42_00990 [Legionellales bacterium]|nr:hypothetical protein [Legionellales bacterium]